jgi:hypothetical protein
MRNLRLIFSNPREHRRSGDFLWGSGMKDNAPGHQSPRLLAKTVMSAFAGKKKGLA